MQFASELLRLLYVRSLYQELTDLQAAKLIRDDLDLTLEANALIALVDGIGTSVDFAEFNATTLEDLHR